jgi:hypothetical protein
MRKDKHARVLILCIAFSLAVAVAEIVFLILGS